MKGTNIMYTPYAASKRVNEVLTDANLPTIPPQMMYNYTSARFNSGKVPFISWTPEDGVDRDDLERWIDEYLAKKGRGRKVTNKYSQPSLSA